MNTWAKFSGGFCNKKNAFLDVTLQDLMQFYTSFLDVKSWPTSTALFDDEGDEILTLSSWCKLLGEDTDVGGGGDEWVGSISTLKIVW